MPGVLSRRSCETCRKARRKCDEQLPSCSRCVRLGLTCKGSGVQRYKFQEVTFTVQPCNETTRLTGAFVELVCLRDPRFDQVMAFGDILNDIPRYMGNDEALDAAVETYTSIFPFVMTGSRSPNILKIYINGMQTLRKSLLNVGAAPCATLWAAVYLMWISQAWFGLPDDVPVSHSQGICQAWSTRRSKDLASVDAFERKILLHLLLPAFVESLLNPETTLTPYMLQFSEAIDMRLRWRAVLEGTNKADGEIGPTTCQMWLVHCFIRLPTLVHLCPAFQYETENLYVAAVRVVEHMQSHIAQVEQESANQMLDARALSTYLQVYCNSAICALILNRALLGYRSDTKTLEIARMSLISRVSDSAVKALAYRPVGAQCASLSLMVAIAVARDHPELQHMVKLLAGLQEDCKGVKFDILTAQARSMFTRIHNRALRMTSGRSARQAEGFS